MNEEQEVIKAPAPEIPAAEPTVKSDFSDEYFPESEMTEYPGYGMVHESEKSDFEHAHAQCAVTGKWHPIIDMIMTEGDEWICQAEYERNWFTCYIDDKVYHNDKAVTVYHYRNCHKQAYTVCKDNLDDYVKCESDGEYWHQDYVQYPYDGADPVDPVTYRENYFGCNDCGSATHRDDMESVGDDCLCPDCARARNRKKKTIQDYSTRIKLGPIGKGDPCHFGIELEVECPSDYDDDDVSGSAEDVIEALGDDYVITKHDGSLDNGFEIVTRPASLSWHRERIEETWSGMPKRLRSWDTDTCGMHVHFSRAPLKKLQIGKIVAFANAEENHKLIITITGRYCDYAKIDFTKKITEVNRSQSDRRMFVNLCNANTVEIRGFKGSTNKDRVIRNIEFCHALVAFTAPGFTPISGLTTAGFCDFVRKSRATYPLLDTFLVERGFLKPASKPDTRGGSVTS